MSTHAKLGLAEAAQALRIPYQDAHRLVLTGVLRGEKRSGRWYVVAADVERLAKDRGAESRHAAVSRK